MLIPFPLGLLITAVLFDVVYLLTDNALWSQIAFWNIAAGIVGGLAAAVFGLIDWVAIPSGTRAKSVGAWHARGNVLMLLLFGASWFLRRDGGHAPGITEFLLELVAISLGAITGWLGGELVDQLGVGVNPGANLDAPNSLSANPAPERSGPVQRGR
jgi:uncharacterized membrane protein